MADRAQRAVTWTARVRIRCSCERLVACRWSRSSATPATCDNTDFACAWTGEVTDRIGEDENVYTTAITFLATAALCAPVATSEISVGCTYEYVFLGELQDGWHMTQELEVSGDCSDGYAFFRLQGDGTLAYEGSLGEFEPRIASASLGARRRDSRVAISARPRGRSRRRSAPLRSHRPWPAPC